MLKNLLDYVLVEDRLNAFFIYSAWILPIAFVLMGVILDGFKKSFPRFGIKFLLWSLIAPSISLLWFAYIQIVDFFGIDSVIGLIVNLCLFILLGIILGILSRRYSGFKGEIID